VDLEVVSDRHYDKQHFNANDHVPGNYISLLHGLNTHKRVVASKHVVEIQLKEHGL
jgi:hypothetical protein